MDAGGLAGVGELDGERVLVGLHADDLERVRVGQFDIAVPAQGVAQFARTRGHAKSDMRLRVLDEQAIVPASQPFDDDKSVLYFQLADAVGNEGSPA